MSPRKAKTRVEEASDQADHHPTPEGPVSTAAALNDQSMGEALDQAFQSGDAPGEPQKKPFQPYRAVITSSENGFELGEDRRFNQRVFTFDDKPTSDIIDKLKAIGFQWRPQERAWTIPANAATRISSERLARELAGQTVEQGVGR